MHDRAELNWMSLVVLAEIVEAFPDRTVAFVPFGAILIATTSTDPSEIVGRHVGQTQQLILLFYGYRTLVQTVLQDLPDSIGVVPFAVSNSLG
jgi:hypothetical protein